MSSCEAGILVVAYTVIVLAVADFFILKRIVKRLGRIEELLVPTAKKNLRDGDDISSSDN